MVFFGVLATLLVPTKSDAVDSVKIDTPVIATFSPGHVAAIWSQPVGQEIADEYWLEICRNEDCFLARSYNRIPYTANSKSSRTSITTFFSIIEDSYNPSSFYLRNRGLPLKARISTGSSPSDSTKSDPSAPFYADPPEASSIDATRQFVQPVLASLSTNSLSMGVCFNRTSDAFRSPDNSQWPVGLRFPGYSLTYEISKDGTVIKSGPSNILGSGIQGNWFNGRYCEDGAEGDERWQIHDPVLVRGSRSPDSLDVGTTYTFTYKLISESSQPISGSLDFTTPGGCPSTPPGPPRHLVKSHWSALLDNSGRYQTVFQGFSPRQSAYMAAEQYANIYLSPFKTFPYNSSFVYVPEIDDFAMDASSLSTSGKFQIKDATIFKDCSPEQVQIAASIEGTPGTSDDSACQIVDGNVIPTRVGRCILRVQLTRKPSVTASGVRTMGNTFTRKLAVDFSSLPPASPVMDTKSPSIEAMVRTVAVKTGTAQSLLMLAKAAQFSVPKGAKVSATVSRTSKKMCKVSVSKVVGILPGKCTITIKVTPKNGKAKVKTIAVNIVGSPTVKRGASISLVNAAAAAGLPTDQGLTVKATITTSSEKNCKMYGSKIVSMQVGLCSASVTVTSNSGAAQTKPIIIRVK